MSKTTIELSESEVTDLRYLILYALGNGLQVTLKRETLLALGFKEGQVTMERLLNGN